MYKKNEPDIEAVVTLLPTKEGGRQGYASSGYRPQHVLAEDWMTSGVQTYIDKEELNPGDSCLANIEFLSPLEKSLWVGREIKMQEGSRIVGHAKVTKIFNQELLRNGI